MLTSSKLSTQTWDVPFLSQPTRFITWVHTDIFDGIAWFHRNKHCFVAYDKLFLEKSLGTHFCQFRFPKVRPIVVKPWKKKLAWLHAWKAKFSRFYICHGICIGSSRCRGHHSTLTAWLYDVIDTNCWWSLMLIFNHQLLYEKEWNEPQSIVVGFYSNKFHKLCYSHLFCRIFNILPHKSTSSDETEHTIVKSSSRRSKQTYHLLYLEF
jgi:hypothetical protein